MSRAYLSLFAVPIVMSMFFGILWFIALPVLMLVTVVVALPVFQALRETRTLNWWHALLAGVICSIAGGFIDLGLIRAGPNEMHGPVMYLEILAASSAAAIAFWWVGIFRNEEFPFVSKRLPVEMLILVPVSMLGVVYYDALKPDSVYGCIISKSIPTNSTAWRYNRVGVTLESGQTVYVSTTKGNSKSGAIGECARVSRRRTLLLTGYVYGTYMANPEECEASCDIAQRKMMGLLEKIEP